MKRLFIAMMAPLATSSAQAADCNYYLTQYGREVANVTPTVIRLMQSNEKCASEKLFVQGMEKGYEWLRRGEQQGCRLNGGDLAGARRDRDRVCAKEAESKAETEKKTSQVPAAGTTDVCASGETYTDRQSGQPCIRFNNSCGYEVHFRFVATINGKQQRLSSTVGSHDKDSTCFSSSATLIYLGAEKSR